MTENNPADFPQDAPSQADANASSEDQDSSVPATDTTENTPAPSPAGASAAALSDDLLTILVCPLTRSAFRQEGDWLVATSPINAGLRYPIRNGIPVLLVDEAALPDGVATLAEFKAQYADAIPG